MAAEAAILPDEFTATAAPAVPALAQVYAEPEPDTMSNALGITLFLPLLAIVYTAIVAATGFSDVIPAGIREKVQGIIWYITGGAGVAALLIIGVAFMLGGGKPAASEKKKKEKKPKKEKKAKKGRKAKKGKKAEEAPEA
jgi:Na+-transporting methylmalonyl-CoA/oxaloacetate decarboxylase gamma subunit